jgi:hypothetical protein
MQAKRLGGRAAVMRRHFDDGGRIPRGEGPVEFFRLAFAVEIGARGIVRVGGL